MTMFFPLSMAEAAIAAIKRAEQASGVRFSIRRGACDLDAVRAALVGFGGTGLWIRTPFVYPFSGMSLRNEFPGKYHVSGGVDWIWLGENADEFPTLLAEHVAANRPETIEVVLFDSLKGRVAQRRDAADVPVDLHRWTRNYNAEPWEELSARLLDAPEQDWARFGANTTDWLAPLEHIIDARGGAAPRVVVDLGCGLGQTARSLARRYPEAKVYGLDSSEAAIEVARRRWRLDNLEFLVAGIGEELPFEAQSVDLLVSVNALMYGPSQTSTAAEVFRVMGDAGLVIHNSRLLDTHMFWDFPLSLLGPTIFQLNAADWIAASRARGFETCIQAYGPMATTSPEFYLANNSKDFTVAFEACMNNGPSTGLGPFHPWHSHALMIHAADAPPCASSMENPSYAARLDANVASLAMAPPSLCDATVLGWNYNLGTLALAGEGKEYIRRCLPVSGDIAAAILL